MRNKEADALDERAKAYLAKNSPPSLPMWLIMAWFAESEIDRERQRVRQNRRRRVKAESRKGKR